MSRDRAKVCGYCGSPGPTTRDHIPPKGVFATPRPDDLITIPSCVPCNQGASERDETFRTYLSIHVGTDTESTSRLWEQVLRGIRRKRPLRRRLIAEVEPVWLTTPSGIIHSRAYAGRWDSDAHDKTIERMIRGLYFHHYQEVLGARVGVKAHWFQKLGTDVLEATAECEQRSVGGGQFVYRFGRASDHPRYSIWLFEFHGRHWAGGQTAPLLPDGERGDEPASG